VRKRVPIDPRKFLAKVGDGKTILTYRKNQIVFSQGEVADAVFYIQKGNIKLIVVSEQGKEAVVAILGPGHFFGEGCLNGHPLRIATARTVDECVITRLEKATMIATVHKEPEFSELFMSYLLTRNSRVEEDLIDQLFNSSEKRLGGSTPHQMLVRLCDRMLWPVELWPGKGQFMHSFSLSRRAFGRGFSSSQSAGTPPSSVSFPFGNLASLNLSRFTSIAVLGGHSMKRNCCPYCVRENEDNTRRRAQANPTSADCLVLASLPAASLASRSSFNCTQVQGSTAFSPWLKRNLPPLPSLVVLPPVKEWSPYALPSP
jgi:CRP-like cAMP-binding protein